MVRLITRILLISCAYLLVCALGYLGYVTYPNNIMGWLLLLIAILYGIGGPYLLWSNLKKENVVRQESHDRSFWLIIPGFLVVFYISPLEYLFISQSLPRAGWMQTIGVILIAASLVLVGWARLAIRGMYSGRLQVISGHFLIQDGPYRVIRHPAYASYLIMSLGMAVGFSSLIGLLAIPFLLVPGLVYRINVEEQLLGAEFGIEYKNYVRNTRRLIPYVW